MYRKCLEKLIEWAERDNRGVMVLRGARQVGKTTLIRKLASELGLHIVEINMEESQSFTHMLEYKEKAKEVLEHIMLEQGINVDPKDVIFFFDEIQELPNLYSFLRYFKEKAPDFKVIAAGSLLEFEINNKNRQQGPTGRIEYSYLNPMTFEEYLMAVNSLAYKKLKELSTTEPVNEGLHIILSNIFKEYLVCGGMPAVVQASVNKEGALRLDAIKNDIITGYIEDLPKYTSLSDTKYDTELLERILTVVMSNPSKGLKYNKIAPGYKAEKVKKHIDILVSAKVIRRSVHTSKNKMPLLNGINQKNYKLFGLDIGLCYSFMGISPMLIYSNVDIDDMANGSIAEQYVAQTLVSTSPFYKSKEIYHWERSKKGSIAEVDFITEVGSEIYPIECKSGSSSKLKSLRLLLEEKSFQTSLRCYSGNVEKEDLFITKNNDDEYQATVVSIPLYMLESFIEKRRGE
jgi:predicted AAA+ superfamily ATPase